MIRKSTMLRLHGTGCRSACCGMGWIVMLVGLCGWTGCASTGSTMPYRGEPGWRREIFLQGEAKRLNDATPIQDRPYRPFHFYGNTVRRLHYRQTLFPDAQDFRGLSEALQSP